MFGNHTPLPFHFYVNVDNSFLGPDMPQGVTKGIWHGLYGREGQTVLCHVFLETGAHWSGIPLHGISTTTDFALTQSETMPWATMGREVGAYHFPFLEGLRGAVLQPFKGAVRHTGLMVDWMDGYSRYPQEHKPLNLLATDSGQFALLPNNFVLFEDRHFVEEEKREDLKRYRRGETVYWGE